MDRDASNGADDTLAATATPNEPVPALLSRYRTGAVIGRGGMGEIVTARDEQIGRSVAIKRLRAKDAPPELLARFLREARIQGRLDHPAIVPVHELCTDASEPFFVMKQLSGTTLAELLETKQLTRQQLLRAFADVCLAVEFAHTRGVVHRDLKPANIMLGDFGEVYVLDWGIARVAADHASRESFADIETADGSTLAGAVLGTPGYMSPEQVRGDADLDGRGDVYALGCILFEILAGASLHPRGQAGMASALAGIDARPSQHVADVPPELDLVCTTATQKDRADRFATSRALGNAVQRFLDGDRDLAMRKELARAELTHARDSLANHAPTEALRAAARALALDPQAREPAELVGRLMLEPPEETPLEVAAEVARVEDAEMRTQAARGGLALLSYFVLLPLGYLAGIRDTPLLILLGVISFVTFGFTQFLRRHRSMPLMRLAIFANALCVALVARVTTPFLLAPALALLTASMFAMHPRIARAIWIYAVFAAAVLVPLALEQLGVISRTFSVEHGAISLRASAGSMLEVPTMVGMIIFVATSLAITIAMARAVALDRARAQQALQLQSWQLRQLVPR